MSGAFCENEQILQLFLLELCLLEPDGVDGGPALGPLVVVEVGGLVVSLGRAYGWPYPAL